MEQKSKIEMHLAGGNNPCGTKEPDRDASGRGEIIPVEQKSKIEMHLTGRNNPCGAKKPDRDASDRGEIIPVEQKSKKGMLINSSLPWRIRIERSESAGEAVAGRKFCPRIQNQRGK